ncbi:hypothetical protein N2152v2_005307 [Parachlorella kessleri]
MQRLLCLALTLALFIERCSPALGVQLEEQLRLGVEREAQLETAEVLRSAAGNAAFASPQRLQQNLGQLPWWRRLWPWRADQQRTVRVRPVWSDGSAGNLVDLQLPESHIDSELQPGGGANGDTASPLEDGTLYDYNTSALMPLIPWAWSWMSDAEQMRNRSNGFDIDVARRLSMYVAISYCNVENLPNWNCTRCTGIAAGFRTHSVVFDQLWNLMAYVGYSEPLNAIVVSFRGTDSHSLYNWAENMRTWRTDLHINYPDAPAGAMVHGGFFYSYNNSALASNVTAAVWDLWQEDKQRPVYVVGHSLGGALATICALDIRLNLGIEDVRLYSYGSPRVGNSVFAEWFRQYVKVRWRFTHNRDMVPSVPIQLMGFRHVAQEVWLLELAKDHTLVGLCDESGEDPRCHNSMCYMGLCSSLMDHLLYLSEMYTPRPGGC